MSSISWLDVAVFSGLAALALGPSVWPYIKSFRLPVAPKPAPEEWQASRIATLISLQGELETRQKPAAVKLCRELIWEILGGDLP
jgi:hypothetical protein